jgi:integrase
VATLAKRVQTRWYKAGQRVAAGTPGAKKVKEKSDCWYIVYKVGNSVRRIKAYTDKVASEAMLTEWRKSQERGAAGVLDPYKVHLDRSLQEHVDEYLEDVRYGGTSEAYHRAVAARLARVFGGIGAKTLRDVTSDKLKAFFRTMVDARVKEGRAPVPVSVTTKNDHRAAVYTFFQWLRKEKRHPENVVERVPRAEYPKGETDKARKRRALSASELATLIRAAATYPVESRKVNRGGRSQPDGAPREAEANLKPETVLKLNEQGRQRRLMYLLAVFTGLRRGELSRVRVKEFKPKRGVIDLPGAKTKNGRRAVIPLVKGLANELKHWVVGKGSDDPLLVVPDRHNLRRLHLAHLKMARIPYQTEKGFADWHSLRKTVNTFLRRKQVPLRQRQLFLRHAAGDLTTSRYDDERLADMGDVLHQLRRLWKFVHRKPDSKDGA